MLRWEGSPFRGACPKGSRPYLTSAPDREGDEEAEEEVEAQDDEVQHRLSSPCLPQLSCPLTSVMVCPALRADSSRGAGPYSAGGRMYRGSAPRDTALPGLIRSRDVLGLR